MSEGALEIIVALDVKKQRERERAYVVVEMGLEERPAVASSGRWVGNWTHLGMSLAQLPSVGRMASRDGIRMNGEERS